MANAIISTLIFDGSIAGQASIQSQPIGGNLIFQLPNIPPIQGQLMTAQAINGSTVVMGWSSAQSLSNIPLSALAQSSATTGEVIAWNGTAWAPSSFVPGSGTVTSVALTAPASILSVGGSPITGSGTLALTLATQSPNQVWAGPTSGGAATPTFRALVAADIGVNTVTIAAINSKRGNGGFVQLAASGTAGAAGDVVTFDANGNTVDSAVLLSSLATTASLAAYAQLTGAAFTGATSVTGAPLTLNFGAGNALIVSAGQAHFQGNVWLDGGQLLDSASSAGTSGQVLTSTGSAALWSNSAVLDNITSTAAGTQIKGTGVRGIYVNKAPGPTDGVFIWDNTGANAFTVGAAAGGILAATSGAGNIALSTGSVTGTNGNVALDANLHVTSANADVKGTITVTNPATSQTFSFARAYASAPTVVVTPKSDPSVAGIVAYWVTSTGADFTVHVNTTPGTSIAFNYQVIG